MTTFIIVTQQFTNQISHSAWLITYLEERNARKCTQLTASSKLCHFCLLETMFCLHRNKAFLTTQAARWAKSVYEQGKPWYDKCLEYHGCYVKVIEVQCKYYRMCSKKKKKELFFALSFIILFYFKTYLIVWTLSFDQ